MSNIYANAPKGKKQKPPKMNPPSLPKLAPRIPVAAPLPTVQRNMGSVDYGPRSRNGKGQSNSGEPGPR
jgi:hypothetical protein